MADLKIKIKGDASSLKNSIKAARTRLNTFGQSVKSFAKSAAGMGMGAIAAGLGLFAKSALKAAAAFEDTSVSFGVMIGNAEKAKNVLDKLMEFSTKTPFEPKEVFAAAKTLMAFGMSADDVTKKIRFLGDISAGTGKDLNELARIFGKAFVKGKVQAEELNQLSEAGVPIIRQLQEEYGRSAEEIFKMGSQGKLTFDALESGMVKMTQQGGTFFEMMSKKSETFNGKMSTLKGNIDNLLISFGNLSLFGGKSMVDMANRAVELYTFGLTQSSRDNIGKWNRGARGEFGKFGETISRETIEKARAARTKAIEAQEKSQAEATARKAEAKARMTSTAPQALGMLQRGANINNLGGFMTAGMRAAGISSAPVLSELQKQTQAIHEVKDVILNNQNQTGSDFVSVGGRIVRRGWINHTGGKI
jgi:tape measure domain-containing protein